MKATHSILLLDGVSDERKRLLLRDLRNQIARLGVPVDLVEGAAEPGTRSDASLWGQLALGVVSGGALVALIDCLKSYIARERKMTIEIHSSGGSSISVTAENVEDPSIHALLQSVLSVTPK